MDLIYTRVSTDQQSTERQQHVLAEAGYTEETEDVKFFSDPATSSKVAALDRPGFQELAGKARRGDRLVVSELYRLCRDLQDILALRAYCQEHGLRLVVLSGALSGITDLASSDATTTMLVNVLVSVGQFQRDLQNELTRDGLAAARANGSRFGRPPAAEKNGTRDNIRDAYLTRKGTIAGLAREFGVSRGAVRTAIADLLPNDAVPEPEIEHREEAEPVATVEIPGKIVNVLRSRPLTDDQRSALDAGWTIRRGRGYSLRVTANHAELLALVENLNSPDAESNDRKAYRVYAQRVAEANGGAR